MTGTDLATGLTAQAWLALALTAATCGLFVWNRLRPDVVALTAATALVVTGLVTPAEGVSGFSNEATVTVAMLLVLSLGLVHTGAVDRLASRAVRIAGGSETRLLLLMIATVVPVSAFLNNTAAVALLLPVLLGASREVDAPPSRLLMPLSFAGQLGGSVTLIGTSTNLLVSGMMIDLGFERIRIFDITPPALLVAAAGIAYLLTVGRWLTPRREATRDLIESYELHAYLSALRVREGSPLADRSLGESRLGEEHGLTVLRIERDERDMPTEPGPATVLRAGDVLLVEAKIADIARIAVETGVDIEGADPHLPRPGSLESGPDPVQLAEILVPPRSPASGRSIRALGLRSRWAVSALGVRRHGAVVHENMAAIRLRPGDVLLVQGRASALRAIHESGLLTLVGPVELAPRRRGKRRWAVLALASAVLLAAFEVVPIMVGGMIGAVLLLLTRTLAPDEVYRRLDWMVVVLLAAILPLGIALERTGAAAWLAGRVAEIASPWGPYGLLAAVYVMTALLTNVISNVAAAALVVPVAGALARAEGLSPTPFAVAVMFAASHAFLTPIAYQTNLFVYGPGGYRFGDFFRVGALLTVVTAAASVFAIPLFLPFEP